MGQRAERFAQLLKEELSQILIRGIKDPRVTDAGLVTVTHVHVSDDLGIARVLVTLHGGDETARRNLLRGLSSARPFFRSELGRRLTSKKLPELRFQFDDTDDRADKIEQLLKEIAEEPK